MQAQAFLDGHRPTLLALVNGDDPAPAGRTGVADFLARVHTDFETVADKPGRRPSLPGEDLFWWCVTILEELDELPPAAAARDPYVAMMRDQLRNLAGRLADGEPLPDGFQIHWFDDDDADGGE